VAYSSAYGVNVTYLRVAHLLNVAVITVTLYMQSYSEENNNEKNLLHHV
jgi:hypothetical protein